MTDPMDEYEKGIREKLFNKGILTRGEWVYLVGLFQTADDYETLRVTMKKALEEIIEEVGTSTKTNKIAAAALAAL